MMKPTLIRAVLVIASAVASVSGVGCERPRNVGVSEEESGSLAQQETWRFAIEEAEGSVQHAYAKHFEQLIEQRTGGAVDVLVYPYGTHGTSTQITEQIKFGVLELAMASPGSLGKFIPEVQVLLLHFMLPEHPEETRRYLSDPELLSFFDALYAPKGLRLLSIYSEGEMVWTTHKEIRRPEDFAGVKFRVMTSPILLAAYNAYGASATPMPYSEVYSGLQLHMIDGQVNPVFAIERQHFYEVTSWMTFPRHAPFITTCAANRDFIDSLSTEYQVMVQSAIAACDEYIFDVQQRLQTERLKVIIEEKQRKQSMLNICGDLTEFLGTLTPEERATLIDNNPYLRVTPELTEQERAKFREASEDVAEVFLKIGGKKGAEVLEWIRARHPGNSE
jgi:TRAP-type C4-dicarboxylate transport system substrate-binding protein